MREDGAREQMRVMGPGWGGFRWVPRFEGREGGRRRDKREEMRADEKARRGEER